jgi:hypothetical protein
MNTKPKLLIKTVVYEDPENSTYERFIELKRVLGPRRIRHIQISQDEVPEILNVLRKRGMDPDFNSMFQALNWLIAHSGDCFGPDGKLAVCHCSEKQLSARQVWSSMVKKYEGILT